MKEITEADVVAWLNYNVTQLQRELPVSSLGVLCFDFKSQGETQRCVSWTVHADNHCASSHVRLDEAVAELRAKVGSMAERLASLRAQAAQMLAEAAELEAKFKKPLAA